MMKRKIIRSLSVVILLLVLFQTIGCSLSNSNNGKENEDNSGFTATLKADGEKLNYTSKIDFANNLVEIGSDDDLFVWEFYVDRTGPDDFDIDYTINIDDYMTDFKLDDVIQCVHEETSKAAKGISESIAKISDSVKGLQDYMTERDSLANQVFSGVVSGVSRVATQYMIQLATESIFNLFGVDARSADKKALDKLQMLDDIAKDLEETKSIVTEISQKITDNETKKKVDERTDALMQMNIHTHPKYVSAVKYLKDGYSEYLQKLEIYNTIMNPDNYLSQNGAEPIANEEYLLKAKTALDKDFFAKYFYIQKKVTNSAISSDVEAGSLAAYMTFRLEYCNSNFKSLIKSWGETNIEGTSAVIKLEHLMERYAEGYEITGKDMTFPEIYDMLVASQTAWEHEGYAAREAFREQDSIIINEASTMLEYYFTLFGNPLSVEEERLQYEKYLKTYNDILAANPVVHHDDYLISIIPGFEFVFAKNLIYFDYYSGLGSVKSYSLFKNSDEGLNPDAVAAYQKMFYSRDITYDYEKLSGDDKNKLTYDHNAIGDAHNPLSKVDWAEVKEFATPIKDRGQYLSLENYQTLYNYYKNKYKDDSSVNVTLNGIVEYIFGVKVPPSTYFVADPASCGFSVSYSPGSFFGSDKYYTKEFKAVSNNSKKNKDCIVVRSTITDKLEAGETRFVDHANFKAGAGYLTGLGYAVFRFCGLEVLGVPKK